MSACTGVQAITDKIDADVRSARLYRILAQMCRSAAGDHFILEKAARRLQRRAARVEAGWGEPK